MPRPITQYRVFIGSPGGLEEERRAFREAIEKFNRDHADHAGAMFAPVACEDALPGNGRPQDLINQDLMTCDYAVFLFHDRWGSPAGADGRVGTEEEWDLAQDLRTQAKIRNIVLFFKNVPSNQLKDPSNQLEKLLAFKRRIEAEKQHLFKTYDDCPAFTGFLNSLLADWLRDHGKPLPDMAARPVMASGATEAKGDTPTARFWINKAYALLKESSGDFNLQNALFCADQAKAAASSEEDWSHAASLSAMAHYHLKNFSAAIEKLDSIVARFGDAPEAALREQVARALFNKGLTLGQLNRSEEEIAVYDTVLARFGDAPETALRASVARALFNKGVRLGQLNRSEEAIAVYDAVLARFGDAPEAALREQVAMALFNKGVRLGQLNRSEEEIAVYDTVLARFGAAPEAALRERVAKALVNKGVTLGGLKRHKEANAAFDEAIKRFGDAPEAELQKLVETAKSLKKK